MERCENCGDKIGALETPCLWDQHVVCQACHAKLSAGKKPQREPDFLDQNGSEPAMNEVPAAVDYKCPKCGSTQTQKLSQVYASGTHTGQQQSSSIGVAFGDDGAMPILAGTSTSTMQQSAQAMRAAPPKRPEEPKSAAVMLLLLGVGAAVAVMVGLSKLDDRFERGIGLFSLFVAVGLAGFMFIRWKMYRGQCIIYERDMKRYAPVYEAWNKRIMCLRCGFVYTP